MKKVLVVDDQIDILKVIRARLEHLHFNVTTALNGEDAIKKAKLIKPDVILMDITMPNMDGGTAVRALRNEPLLSDTPVIFVTAALAQNDDSEYFRKGITVDEEVFDVVPKPIDFDVLINKINHLVGV